MATIVTERSEAVVEPQPRRGRVEWLRVLPFFLLHAACLAVFWVGWSWPALAVALVTYAARVFGLTGFYHRYFSHRSFKTSRLVQFLGALLGNMAGQRGPIWWAAHHRHHHRHADDPHDVHSPRRHGFWWSHMLWFLTRENYETNERLVRDWLKYPELRWIDRHDFAAPALLALVLYMVGAIVGAWWPATGSTGWQFVVWGFVVSTVVLYHVTYSINSIAHRFGTRRFATPDDSRNNWLLAVVTFGEGWHNNHHHYPAAARQGFFWWEIDLTWYALVLLSWCGLVWDLKGVPARALAVGQVPPTNGSRT